MERSESCVTAKPQAAERAEEELTFDFMSLEDITLNIKSRFRGYLNHWKAEMLNITVTPATGIFC